MRFSESVKVGRVGEELVRQLLDWAGVNTSWNDAKDVASLKKHDIHCELNGTRFTVEAKHDAMQARTKNIALEFFNPVTNKPSGLMATSADIWATVLSDPMAVWVCRTEDLKRYFENEKPVKNILKAGDGNASIRIFKSDKLLNAICQRIDEEPPWEVLSILTKLLSEELANGSSTRVAHPVQDVQCKQRTAVENRNLSC